MSHLMQGCPLFFNAMPIACCAALGSVKSLTQRAKDAADDVKPDISIK